MMVDDLLGRCPQPVGVGTGQRQTACATYTST